MKGAIFILIVIILLCYYSRRENMVETRAIVTFYHTKWCPACSRARIGWEKVKAKISSMNVGVHFREVDVDQYPTPFIKGVPTFVLIDSTGRRYTYHGYTFDATMLHNWILAPQH